MLNFYVYVATSLDGYIARPDGDVSWLEKEAGPAEADTAVDPGEDYGFEEFYSQMDVIAMGRHSFEKVITFPEWPYEGKKVVVLSSRMKVTDVPDQLQSKVQLMSGTPFAVRGELLKTGVSKVYVDGGNTATRFIAAGLVSEVTVTYIPILLGAGIPLFGSVPKDIHLKLKSSRAYKNGFVQSTYSLPTVDVFE